MVDNEHGAIVALKNGDIRGLESLVQLHQVRALRTAYSLTGDRQMAEDIVADAFLVVYDHIQQFDMQRTFQPWFYRIVVTRALKMLRETRRTSAVRNKEALLLQVDPAAGPEMSAVRRETQLALQGAVSSLPPAQRATWILRYYLDMDEHTIADTLGCPLGTVKWRLYSAKKRLRHNLKRINEYCPGYLSKGELR